MKRILVTGASKGIGKGIAQALAHSNVEIVIHYGNDKKGAEETQEMVLSLGGHSRILSFDVSNRAQCLEVLNEDISKNGAYWGLVNNAGITRDGAFPSMTDQDWDQVINTNLNSFFNVVKPCVMPMVRARNGGRIICVVSVSGILGNRGQVNYSASKAGLIGACKALSLELAKREITVNCVAPGLIDTGMVNYEIFDRAKEFIPLRRMGKVEEVAEVVKFLMSSGAAYITRQVISVDGGMS